MDDKGQVSLEYLLTILFSVVLAMIVAVMALNITQISTVAQTKILAFREETIASLLGG
jgi:uncharacterized protein (UPF0333 family)